MHCASSLTRPPHDVRHDHKLEGEKFGAADDLIIWIIVPHEVKRVNEDDEERITKHEQHQLGEEQRTREDKFG